MVKLNKVDDYLAKKLKDPYFKELWELEQQKLELIRPLIEYRMEHDLTQAQLAKEIKCTQQHISDIENGRFSDLATVYKILLYIGYRVRIHTSALSKPKAKQIMRSMKKAEVIGK